jgi:hypothetical protein
MTQTYTLVTRPESVLPAYLALGEALFGCGAGRSRTVIAAARR